MKNRKLPLLAGLAVTTLVTLGLDTDPALAVAAGVIAGGFAVFGLSLVVRL